MTLWMFVVYFPQAHMVWGIDGFMNGVLERRREDSRRLTSPAARWCI